MILKELKSIVYINNKVGKEKQKSVHRPISMLSHVSKVKDVNVIKFITTSTKLFITIQLVNSGTNSFHERILAAYWEENFENMRIVACKSQFRFSKKFVVS